MAETSGILKIQLLGDFRMWWGDEEILLKSGSTTKAMQILQLLLFYAPKRISSGSLIAQIFAYDDILSPSNNLKAYISLLRRQLRNHGLPAEEYIDFVNGGYVWSCPLPISVDVHNFERAIKKVDSCNNPDSKIALYEEASRLYTGEFLTELVGIDWVSPLNIYYSDLYGRVMRSLSSLYQAKGDYEQVLSVAERAEKMLHTDEWQLLRMKSLMKLERWDQAKQVYMDAVAVMAKEYGLKPSEEMLEQYRIISSQLSNALGTFHDMLDSLRESAETGGAYFCTYPGFIDSCRVTARSMERSGISCFLMLCCLCDSNGRVLQNEERLQNASEKLREAIQKSLRNSDFYTQYNRSQFLIFLMGSNRENCSIVQDRIENNFRSMSVRGVYLWYEVSSALLDDFGQQKTFGGMPKWK